LLLLLFAGSGCSALIYEIVWYQLLQLVIGSTAVSLGVLLATFMGGLCLGSLALPRIRSLGGRHPLRVYALVEMGIGICGILVLFGMPLVDRVYVAAVGHGLPAMLLRAVVAAACLLPPTVLMGASLPAASRWLETTPEGVSWMGLLYGGNTAGAVFGCLLAGFYLLRVHDMATATLVAAAINGAVALISFGMASRTPHQAGAEEPPATPWAEAAPRSGAVYVTIALSGACALGAEVVWTRLLGLLLGATVYTFSIILAVFLAGLGIGSGIAAALVRGVARPRIALGCCQLLLAGAVAWTAYMLANSLPYWPINPLLSTSPWFTFQIDLARSTWAILPAALLWGASFPLALAAVASRGRDAGRMVGGIYAANTAGAIVGALAFSMLLIPAIGTQGCERVLIVLSAVSALFAWRRPGLRAKAGVLLLAAAVGGRRSPGHERLRGPIHADRLWPPHHDLRGQLADSLRGRRHERLHRHLAVERRRGAVPRQRQGGGFHGTVRHAPAAHAGPHARAAAPESPFGAGGGVRRGRHRRLVCAAPRSQENRHLRNGAHDSAGGDALLRQGEQQRSERPARRNGLRRRAPLRPDHPGKVRCDHLRPDSSVGQRQRHALFQRVL
jgi:hypothetical protein